MLREKNGVIAINNEPRNLIYDNLPGFENVIACSYSGNNFGVDLAFRNNLKKYLLSNNRFDDDVTYLQYKTTIPEEKSFISLAATLIPISVVLDYYSDGEKIDICKETFSFDTKMFLNCFTA